MEILTRQVRTHMSVGSITRGMVASGWEDIGRLSIVISEKGRSAKLSLGVLIIFMI